MGKKRKRKEEVTGWIKRWNEMDRFTRWFIGLAVSGVLFILTIIVTFKLILAVAVVVSGSMSGTIEKGNVVLGTRFDINEEEIQRYDILLFTNLDEPGKIYVKRVIGLPGETIEVKDGKVYADGVMLDDSFVKKPMNKKGDGVYVVPEGCYFFLGDNRNNSNDSRFWDEKYVPLENVIAKAKVILLPFEDAALL